MAWSTPFSKEINNDQLVTVVIEKIIIVSLGVEFLYLTSEWISLEIVLRSDDSILLSAFF